MYRYVEEKDGFFGDAIEVNKYQVLSVSYIVFFLVQMPIIFSLLDTITFIRNLRLFEIIKYEVP